MYIPPPARPSRTYKDGIGKPVVAKRWDEILQAFYWTVVFPPCNNFGGWIVEPEARLVGKAQNWCFRENDKIHQAARAARTKEKAERLAEKQQLKETS